MAVKRKKRPRDPIQLAKLIGDIATGQTEDQVENGKNAAASELGRIGGLKGGAARAKNLPPEQRVEIARIAANARWEKSR
ncbi:MAG: RNA-binding protein [Nitrospirae bacterium]|nr:RNA-binding protein [Nitrospirota bacterium]